MVFCQFVFCVTSLLGVFIENRNGGECKFFFLFNLIAHRLLNEMQI